MKQNSNLANILTDDVKEVINIEIEKLRDFKNHTFNLYKGKRLDELVNSIKENGVITPIIVREKEHGEYEILSGHNRVNALRILNEKTAPAIVAENLSEEETYAYVIETNLQQRSFNDLSLMEKAKTLKLRNETYKKQKVQNGQDNKKTTREKIADEFNLSSTSVFRYIKLNDLIDEFKEMIDKEEINLDVASKISRVSKEKQMNIYFLMSTYDVKVDGKMLKKLAQSEYETVEKLEEILLNKNAKKEIKKKICVELNENEKGLFKEMTDKEIANYIHDIINYYVEKNNLI